MPLFRNLRSNSMSSAEVSKHNFRQTPHPSKRRESPNNMPALPAVAGVQPNNAPRSAAGDTATPTVTRAGKIRQRVFRQQPPVNPKESGPDVSGKVSQRSIASSCFAVTPRTGIRSSDPSDGNAGASHRQNSHEEPAIAGSRGASREEGGGKQAKLEDSSRKVRRPPAPGNLSSRIAGTMPATPSRGGAWQTPLRHGVKVSSTPYKTSGYSRAASSPPRLPIRNTPAATGNKNRVITATPAKNRSGVQGPEDKKTSAAGPAAPELPRDRRGGVLSEETPKEDGRKGRMSTTQPASSSLTDELLDALRRARRLEREKKELKVEVASVKVANKQLQEEIFNIKSKLEMMRSMSSLSEDDVDQMFESFSLDRAKRLGASRTSLPLLPATDAGRRTLMSSDFSFGDIKADRQDNSRPMSALSTAAPSEVAGDLPATPAIQDSAKAGPMVAVKQLVTPFRPAASEDKAPHWHKTQGLLSTPPCLQSPPTIVPAMAAFSEGKQAPQVSPLSRTVLAGSSPSPEEADETLEEIASEDPSPLFALQTAQLQLKEESDGDF